MPVAVKDERAVTARTLDNLAVILTGRPLGAKDAGAVADEIASGSTTVEAFVDAQLAEEGFARQIASSLVFGGPVSVKERHPVAGHSVLRARQVDGERVYFLRAPCPLDEAVAVHPWWDPDDPIRVCPEAYRPESRGDAEGRTCGASMLSPGASQACGCGPRLMYCSRDAAHFAQVRQSLKREIDDTVVAVVEAGGPIDPLFTGVETVRDRNAEFVYRRARVAAGEDPALLDLEDFGEKARRAPRHEQVPGHHAGLLTAPALVYGSDALRGVMRNYYTYLWCSEPTRSNVTTEAVMKLGKVDLRVGDGWRQLAAMDVCTDCHARLDYGMQFFNGYPSSVNGLDFRPREALAGEGPLYGADIGDARGTGPLTPNGFARLALAQPEFGQCLTRRVVDHVFNGMGTAADFDAVEAVFARTRDLKQMVRVAALRLAVRPPAPVAAAKEAAVATEAAVAAVGDEITVPAPVRAFMDNHCVECHDEGERYPLHHAKLPRATVEEMLDLVAFGVMPATPRGLDDEARRRFVALTVPLLWSDPAEQAMARAFYSDAYRAHPVPQFGAAMRMVADRAGSQKRPSLSMLEYAIQQGEARFSPGFATAAGLTALTACKAAGEAGDALVACVARASAPEALIMGEVGPAAMP
ncbi:MAG: hypothetical protein H6701_06750 [Myxococcales bacterium]|nr:hypothetical protein [Myxococcales bacterium]